MLFAFAQFGAFTHEITHVDDIVKHSQKSQSTHTEQCEQCISFAKIAGGLQAQSFVYNFAQTAFLLPAYQALSYSSQTYTAYAARAPPYII